MEKRQVKQQKNRKSRPDEEVSSIEWELVKMSEQEEDLVYRMHKLVGDRWELIAGRIPGRKAEEIERFWLMRHNTSHPQSFGSQPKRCNLKNKF